MNGGGTIKQERFWSKVRKSGDCWFWEASRDKEGYGNFWFRGRVQKAHRVVWMLTHGEIPDGMFVCHHCDNPSCVNPFHLFLGTAKDNMQDASLKGRARTADKRGERNQMVKLTVGDVHEIRRLHAAGMSRRELAKRFPVGVRCIGNVVTRTSWAHVECR